jgi:Tfp pilus assembly protein PilF
VSLLAINLARALCTAGRFREAANAFRLALAECPPDIEVLLEMAHAQVSGDMRHAAARTYQEILELQPDCAAAFNGIACCETNLERAEAALLRAVELDPGNASFRANLAAIYAKRRRMREAENEFVLAFAASPDDPVVVNNYGRFLIHRGRLRAATELFRRAARHCLRGSDEDADGEAARIQRALDRGRSVGFQEELGAAMAALAHYERVQRRRHPTQLEPGEATLDSDEGVAELVPREDSVDTMVGFSFDHVEDSSVGYAAEEGDTVVELFGR